MVVADVFHALSATAVDVSVVSVDPDDITPYVVSDVLHVVSVPTALMPADVDSVPSVVPVEVASDVSLVSVSSVVVVSVVTDAGDVVD